MQTTLQRKATPELYTLAEQIATLQDAHPDTFRAIAHRAAAVYLELFHQTEPNPHGNEVGLIEGRAACWPMYRDRYTSQEQCRLRIVSLCALTDALLTRKRTLPDALPFVVLTRALLYCGDKAGFTMPLLQSGLDQLTLLIQGTQSQKDTPERKIIEIELGKISNGLSKKLLIDLILNPDGVRYDSKMHGAKQPDNLKAALSRNGYTQAANAISKSGKTILIKTNFSIISKK